MKPKRNDVFWRAAQQMHEEFERVRRTRAGFEGSKPEQIRANRAHRIDDDRVLRQVVDEAVRCWISEKKWMPMESAHAILIADRFANGLSVASFLMLRGVYFRGKTVNELLEFFLIDCWAKFGINTEMGRLLKSR
jgi:hypothetical protein